MFAIFQLEWHRTFAYCQASLVAVIWLNPFCVVQDSVLLIISNHTPASPAEGLKGCNLFEQNMPVLKQQDTDQP